MSEREFEVLPEGISAETFAKAVAEFEAVLGAGNVISDEERLTPYFKTMMPVDDDLYKTSCVIQATTVVQVQAVVKICNTYEIPVWTISTGRNFGYGTAAPAKRGTVVLDLKHMNKIIAVDRDLGTALVEPGVTYQQLFDYLQENDLPFYLSCPAPSAIAGPVGNTMDRGVGYTPYGEHFMMQCGMEVVLANGEVLRTGMGGVEGNSAWQVFKWGYGPYLDGIFTQSNFGICTKMGFWLMPKPPVYKPFCVIYDNEEDISEIVDLFRPLRLNGIIPNSVVYASTIYEAAAIISRRKYFDGEGFTPHEVIQEIREKEGIGAWNVYAALYGTKEQVEVNWNIVKATIEGHGKGRIITEEEAGGKQPFQYRADLMRGNMTMQEFGLYRWRDDRGAGGGSMWFAPVTVNKGSETLDQTRLATEILNKHGFDYAGEYIVGMRDLHHIIDVLFDKSDEEETQRAYECFDELLTEFAKRGYAVYRVNNAFMDKVADIYGETQREINRTLKRALDPKGILAPGKSGITI
ncbi:FAD-dependent oxidoreductase [Ochrobactrum sp. AP1BH01-1]|uniref:FAD-binding oxidoreductase n=1 Tax=Ochrobactrum sp. AP1BH01-1 TaxID=2823874 RepID=UPI001B395CA1|nr:FAD-dependent oxidoreductase [Ochrobactrum sp. AP1BH01-1]MBQ0711307.1 FAD-dependent oxidoreductase [Ochrobactrum sp. AP1BH01-1]